MKRRASLTVVAILVSALLAGEASAQRGDPYFRAAQQQFLALKPETRLWFQIFLTSAGYWSAVPNVSYSTRLFDATKQLQRHLGELPTGRFTSEQLDRMLSSASSVLAGWNLRRYDHPSHRAWIWIPAGLDPEITNSPQGAQISSWRSRLRIRFEFFPGQNLAQAHQATRDSMIRGGDQIVYSLLKPGFMVVSGRQGQHQRYVRYHDDGAGLVGIDMTWSGEDAPAYGDRLVTIVSSSLWASMTGAPMPVIRRHGDMEAPPAPPSLRERHGQPVMPSKPLTPAAPSPAQQPDAPEQGGASTGSGFSVSTSGHFLTNAHVVQNCRHISIRGANLETHLATLLARDDTNDLALLHAAAAGPVAPLPLRSGVRLGETVAAFGFPHSTFLSTSGNFTLGNVTALTGMRDDTRFLQISAPVQSGNSGGPLLDAYGNLVGVVTAKLNAMRIMASSGDLPQNVNFAVKATLAASFLDTRQVEHVTGIAGGIALEAPDIAERARKASVFVRCKR